MTETVATRLSSGGTRMPFFDNARGIVIFLTVIVNLFTSIPAVPGWIGHAKPEINALHVADVGVVAFITVLSILYSYNFKKKSALLKKSEVYRFYALKSLSLIGVGFIISLFEHNFAEGINSGLFLIRWNIITTYGFINMFSLFFIALKKQIRLVIGIIFIFFHQIVILNIPTLRESILINDQGGLYGILAWLGLSLLITVLGDCYFENKKYFYIFSGSVILIGAVCAVLSLTAGSGAAPLSLGFVNKHYINAAYIFISLACVVAVFCLLDLWPYFRNKTIPFIGWLGQSSLFFFIWGAVAGIIILALLGPSRVKTSGTGLDAFLSVLLYIPFLFIPAWLFNKKKIRIQL